MEAPTFCLQNKEVSALNPQISRFSSKGQVQLRDPVETSPVAPFHPDQTKPLSNAPKNGPVSDTNYSQASSLRDMDWITPKEMEKTKNSPSLKTNSI